MSLQLILKHSSVSGKAPTAAQLAEGEISLNLHADGPFLCCKDTAGDVVQLGGVTISATAPTTTKAAFWLDTSGTDPVLKVYDGSAWKSTSVVPTVASIAGTAPVTASTTGGVATIGISDASQTAKGAVQLATAAETTTGTSATKAVHPAGLKVELDKKASLASPPFTGTPTAPTAAAGTKTTQLATTAFVDAAITAQPDASETVKGIAELATQAETTTGTDDARIVTPKKLKVELDKKVDEAPDGTADGTAQYARQVVTAGTGGTPSNAKTWAKIENFWKRTGTELSPATAGDTVQISAGTTALPGLTPVGDPNTGVWAPAADTLAVSVNGSECLRIAPDGKVGLGTSSPNYMLEVNGGFRAWGFDSYPTRDLSISAHGPYSLLFSTNYQERVRIDGSGRLLVGMLGGVAGSAAKLQCVTTANLGGVAVYADNTAAKAAGLVVGEIYRKADGTLMITF